MSSLETACVDTSDQTEGMTNLPEDVPLLTALYLYLSDGCNLACSHCWIGPTYYTNGKGAKHMKLDYVQKAIKEAKPLGLQFVKLTGGEPTLHPQLRELITLIREEGLKITIETNGVLIDQELAEFLVNESRVAFISISLDGASAETYEKLRGVKGSFDRAVGGIRALVALGFHPQVICTLHRGNVSEIEAITAFAEELGCSSIKFNVMQQIGRGKKFVQKQGLDVSEILDLNAYVEKELIPKAKIPIYFDVPMAFHSIRRMTEEPIGKCRFQNILGILAGGELSLCGIGFTQPDLIYGHIESSSLQDIWYNHSGLLQLREQIPAQLEGVCGQCIHKHICQGSCIANNYSATGEYKAAYYLCSQADKLGLFPASRKK
jgi:SynChlorMet cassette radical SAM/SPASM protein ScmF